MAHFENECKSFNLDEAVVEKIDDTEAVEHNEVLNKLSDKNLEKFKTEQELPKAIITGIVVGVLAALLWGLLLLLQDIKLDLWR